MICETAQAKYVAEFMTTGKSITVIIGPSKFYVKQSRSEEKQTILHYIHIQATTGCSRLGMAFAVYGIASLNYRSADRL